MQVRGTIGAIILGGELDLQITDTLPQDGQLLLQLNPAFMFMP